MRLALRRRAISFPNVVQQPPHRIGALPFEARSGQILILIPDFSLSACPKGSSAPHHE
jgi:hypothetical protein